MQRPLLLLLAAMTLLAGCLDGGGSPDDDPDDDPQTDPDDRAPLPDDISESATVPAGGDPFNIAGAEPCSEEVSGCTLYPFTVPAGIQVEVDALLSWLNPANDFDLYLYTADGQQISMEGINQIGDPPETEHDMPPVRIGPGEYEFYVVAWAVAGGQYTLEATFAYA